MMMAVDKSGQQDFVATADYWQFGMPARQIGKGAEGGDAAILLQHRSVADFLPMMPIERPCDHRAAADQGCGHVSLALVFVIRHAGAPCACHTRRFAPLVAPLPSNSTASHFPPWKVRR